MLTFLIFVRMNLLSKIRDKIRKYYPSELSFLFLLLGMVFTLFLFIEIADSVSEGKTYSIDNSILLLLRNGNDSSEPLGPERLQYIVRDITSLGSSTILTIITLFVVLFLYLKKEFRSIIYVLFATIGGGILVQVLKLLFARERPDIVTHLASEVTMSFPSGHSAMSAVVYLSLAVLLSRIEKEVKTRIFIISAALIVAFIVGVSRIYLGVHYPTDVLAGWSIGLFWALLCWFGATIIEKRKLN